MIEEKHRYSKYIQKSKPKTMSASEVIVKLMAAYRKVDP